MCADDFLTLHCHVQIRTPHMLGNNYLFFRFIRMPLQIPMKTLSDSRLHALKFRKLPMTGTIWQIFQQPMRGK